MRAADLYPQDADAPGRRDRRPALRRAGRAGARSPAASRSRCRSRPPTPGAVAARLDGLLLSGGEDVEPARSGAAGARATCPARDAAELALLAAARARALPVLGVCRGLQLLNVAFGGTLVDGLDDHDRRHAPFDEPGHPIACAAGTAVAALYGERAEVNSVHRQGIGVLGTGLRAAAHAPDGLVEAVEHADEPLLGVQWHPEYHPAPDPAFRWLVAAATERAWTTSS